MKELSDLVLPAGIRYTKDHEWVSPTKPHRIGVSDFAQDQLGDLTFVEFPAVGIVLKKGAEFGALESIKSVSAIYAPVDGKVTAINEGLKDDPGLVNRDPYGEGWLIEIEPADPAQFDALLDVGAYTATLKDAAK